MEGLDALKISEDKKKYIVESLNPVLEEMVAECIHRMPRDPVPFMLEWLEQKKVNDDDKLLSPEEKERINAGNKKLQDEINTVKPQMQEEHLELLHQHFPFKGFIPKTELRAITVSQLQSVIRFCEANVVDGKWYDTNPRSAGQPLSMDVLNLYHVNAWIIEPATILQKCAFVELCSDTDQVPDWFVSHWWGDLVRDFVKCIAKHCEIRRLSAKTCFWICAYANRQHRLHEDICNNPTQSSFFRALEIAKGFLLLLDDRATPFTRAWCAFEISMALLNNKMVDLVDIVVCQNGEVSMLTEGVPEDDKYFKTLFREGAFGQVGDAIPSNMARVALQNKFDREGQFPVEILETILHTKIEKSQASEDVDRQRILNVIADRDIELPPLDTHPNYAKVHRLLVRTVILTAWPQLLAKGLVDEWGLVEKLREDTELQKVVLCFNYIKECDDAAVASLARGLPPSVTNLDIQLVGCPVGDSAVETLAANMPPQLESLAIHFNDTSITDVGAVAIAKSMPSSIADYDVRFHNCKVSDVGAIAISQKLSAGMKSIVLNFAGCDSVSDSTALAVAEGLSSAVESLVIYFGGTKVTDVGLAAVAAALPTKLQHLTLFYPNSSCTDAGTAVLAKEIHARSSVTSLRIVHTWPPTSEENFHHRDQLLKWLGPISPAHKCQAPPANRGAQRSILCVVQ